MTTPRDQMYFDLFTTALEGGLDAGLLQRGPAMKIWNVRLQVVDLVPAATAEEAVAKLASRLSDDHYLPYTEGGDPGDAFESEALDPDLESEIISRYKEYR